jgi:virulence-associated protein VagC
MAEPVLVRLIDDGDGQIVLIPPAFELDAEEVELERRGDAVVLHPLPRSKAEPY